MIYMRGQTEDYQEWVKEGMMVGHGMNVFLIYENGRL